MQQEQYTVKRMVPDRAECPEGRTVNHERNRRLERHVELLPREVKKAEVEQDITQRDQFNTEDVALAETLIRESHQNSLDALHGDDRDALVVRTRLSIREADPADSDYWRELLTPLEPHLQASRVDCTGLDLGRPRVLVIEDFGTTGLKGPVDRKDKSNFSDFWRRFGVSNKSGGAAGRWGLGKLVYSSASRIGVFFGLTIRRGDPKRYLMGQAVLNNHTIDNKDYAPHLFFAVRGPEDFQLPVEDPGEITRFSQAVGFTRTTEPGLSIAIICVQEKLDADLLLSNIIRNYFFPILRRQLEVEAFGTRVTADTFDELASRYADSIQFPRPLREFVRALEKTEPLLLESSWTEKPDLAIPSETCDKLRAHFQAGKIVAVKAPLRLKRKNDEIVETHVLGYLQKLPEDCKPQALFVRGRITIPGEARYFQTRRAMAALLALDDGIVEFLGDAENPAHTRWSGTAKKLTEAWRSPDKAVRAVRRLLNDLYDLIAEVEAQIDEDVFSDFFSIPAPDPAKKRRTTLPRPPSLPPSPPKLPAPARYFNLIGKKGGFLISARKDVTPPNGLRLTIEVAYAVLRGNAFRKFHPSDFSFRDPNHLNIRAEGLTWEHVAENKLELLITSPSFRFEVSGFDVQRDLEINVEEAES